MQYSFMVRKRARDNYQLIISYKGKDGKWHQKAKGGYKKARLASSDEEVARLLGAIKDLIAVERGHEDITLKDFLDIYAADHKLRPRTKRNYEDALSFFGNISEIPMRDVSLARVKKVLTDSKNQLVTKNMRITILKVLFKAAYEEYAFLPSNPVQRLKMYNVSHEIKDIKVLDDTEVALLLEEGKHKPEYRVAVAIGVFAGLRIGEILGLTRNDVDLKAGTLTVRRQWRSTGKYAGEFTSLKTKNSVRTIPIPPRLKEILAEYMASQKVISFNGKLIPDNSRVTFGVWMRRLVHKTPHALRHTYITNLVANGVDVKTVAALAGDTPATIFKHYIHYTDSMREKAKDDVARIFG